MPHAGLYPPVGLPGVKPSGRLAGFYGLIVFVVALACTLGAWRVLSKVEQREEEARFNNAVQRALSSIKERVRQHEDVLRGARALLAANRSISQADWEEYVRELNLGRRYPGIRGLLFAARLPQGQLDQWAQFHAGDEASGLKNPPPSGTQEHAAVVLAAPKDECGTALGSDLGAEPAFRETAQHAAERDRAYLTPSLTLKHTRDQTRGMLLFLPIYRKGSSNQAGEDQQNVAVGWVVGVLVMQDLMQDIGSLAGNLELKIYDGAETVDDSLLYDSDPRTKGPAGADQRSQTVAFNRGGRQHTLLFKYGGSPSAVGLSIPIIILMAGIVLSVLLSLLVQNMSTTRSRAIQLAEEMTRAHQESEGRFRDIAELLPQVIYETDATGRLTFVNRRALTLLAYTREDFDRGLNALSMIAPADRERAEKAMQRVLRGEGESHGEEYLMQRRDGSTFPVAIYNSTIVRDGKPSGVRGLVVDITARKQVEEALRKSEEKYRELVQNANSIILRMDGTGRVTFFNEFAQQFFGYDEQEILGKQAIGTLVSSIESPDRDLETLVAELQRNRDRASLFERESVKRNGERVVVSWTVKWIAGGDGLEEGLLCVGNDITAHRQLEVQLRQAEKMDTIGQLAGGVAHDFNNQLFIVLGHADLLASQLTDPQLKRSVESIQAAVNRSAGLTQKLLAFARKGQYQSVPVNIHALIEDCVAVLERSIDKRIHIGRALNAREAVVNGDPGQLQNVILNLGLNARDAMPEGGALSFGTETIRIDATNRAGHPPELAEGDYLELCVSDTGCGMSPDVRKHLFEPFFTTKPVGKGTGMGLASVYGTVKHHRGAIVVVSEMGRGTMFRLHFPLAEKASAKAASRVQAGVKPDRLRVLVVDDEPMVRELMSAVLRDAGHEVRMAGDGKEAVAAYLNRWEEIDLVVLDMVMPEMNGIDTFRALRRINRDARVLLVSGFSVEGDATTLLSEGAAGFVQKPVGKEALVAAALNAVNG